VLDSSAEELRRKEEEARMQGLDLAVLELEMIIDAERDLALANARAGASRVTGARIRLDAFPWTAYGALSATVQGVGSEPREQKVRVELQLTDDDSDVPPSHGMTGAVDV